MRRLPASVVAVAAVTIAVACSDINSPSTPTRALAPSGVSQSAAPGLSNVRTLLRDHPIGKVSASKQIDGRQGGSISLPEAGFVLVVPPGAYSGTLTISVTSLPGRAVGYEFEPHGTYFNRPLIAQQTLAGLNDPQGPLNLAGLNVGYFTSSGDVDGEKHSARVSEQLSVSVAGGVMTYLVPHFSGWLTGCGRGGDDW